MKLSGRDYQLRLAQGREVAERVTGKDEQVGGEAGSELTGGVREPEDLGCPGGGHLDDLLGGEVPQREALQRHRKVTEGSHSRVGAGDQADPLLGQPSPRPTICRARSAPKCRTIGRQSLLLAVHTAIPAATMSQAEMTSCTGGLLFVGGHVDVWLATMRD